MVNHTYKELSLFPKDIVGGGCLEAGTMIVMADNTLRNIEDVKVGEKVKTIFENCEVTATWNPDTLEEGTPECFEIEFEDGYKVVCSDQHKFYIDNKWVEAKDLVVGMECGTVNVKIDTSNSSPSSLMALTIFVIKNIPPILCW